MGAFGMVGDRLLMSISVFASIGVFLFGFDQGVMSGIITGPFFNAYFHRPEPHEIATMVAILEIGAFCTSLLSGYVGDVFGRRATLFAGASIFVVGGAFQTFTLGFKSMVFGRIIAGFGVGFLSMIVPVYQSEISPAEHRGKLACIEFTGNIAGYAFSVWIGYFCSFLISDYSWRLPLGVQCIIGSILAIGSLFIPESPRWLLDQDMDEEGMQVLADLHGDGDLESPKAREEFREIKEGVLADRMSADRGYKTMWRRYKYRVLIAMSAQAFAQLNGINVISYYAPLVFRDAGWIGRSAILMTGINGIIYILSTIPTWYLVDIWGRRPVLLSGALIMSAALSSVGYFMYLDKSYTPLAVVISVIVFNAAFGYSWGPIPWLYPPEIMPNAFRVKGVSLSTATNWFFNFIVGESTPTLQVWIRWRVYPMHALFCLISFTIVYFGYPETMGVPLEEMDRIFGDSSSRHDLESASLGSRPGSPSIGDTVKGWLGKRNSTNGPGVDASAPEFEDGGRGTKLGGDIG
ncbi:general substrate transporter [Meredithblackwellia eburnea MCA 4105]